MSVVALKKSRPGGGQRLLDRLSAWERRISAVAWESIDSGLDAELAALLRLRSCNGSAADLDEAAQRLQRAVAAAEATGDDRSRRLQISCAIRSLSVAARRQSFRVVTAGNRDKMHTDSCTAQVIP